MKSVIIAAMVCATAVFAVTQAPAIVAAVQPEREIGAIERVSAAIGRGYGETRNYGDYSAAYVRGGWDAMAALNSVGSFINRIAVY